jgi:predicted transcriptional regulator
MRNHKTSDIFSLSRIVKKMDIKKQIAEVAKDVTDYSAEDKTKAETTMQASLVLIFVENIGSAEKEIYNFLADVTDSTAKEIEDMGIPALMALINDLLAQDGIGGFLSSALK